MSNKNETKLIRGRKKTCDGKLKEKKKKIRLTQNGVIKNIMIHQSKVQLQKRINNIYIYIYIEREREREITFFGREIENKMRKRSIKIKNIYIVISQTLNYPSHDI